MNDQGKAPSKLDQLTTAASRKFSDWSVEIFIGLVVVGVIGAFFLFKDKLEFLK